MTKPISPQEQFNAARMLYALLDIYQEIQLANTSDTERELIERAEALHEATPLEEVVGAAFTGYQAMMAFMNGLRVSLPEDDEDTRSALSGQLAQLLNHLVPGLYWSMRSLGGATEAFFKDTLTDFALTTSVEEFIKRKQGSPEDS